MINPEILREYDIRGIYEKSLTLNDVTKIALSITKILINNKSPNIIIGHDGRISSLKIKNTLIENFTTYGIEVIDISLIPTPLSYFSSKCYKIPNLIMITGSHNPKEYNGLKMIIDNKPFFGKSIKSLNEVDVSSLIKKNGSVKFQNPLIRYQNEILNRFSNINQLKIVWDPGNGAIGAIINKITNMIGGTNIILNQSIDGTFPNHHPDPTVKSNIIEISDFIKKNSFDLGVAFDGDGDRVGILDNKGNLVYSDMIFLLLTLDLQKEKKDITAVADVKCSKILFDVLKENGIRILMSKTGHSLIKQMIVAENADIAGEMSGHIFYNHGYYGYDDAIYASLKFINILNSSNNSLSDILEPYMQSSSSPEIKLYCKESEKFDLLSNIISDLKVIYNDAYLNEIDGIRVESSNFWFLIRASNTQNCLVFRLEHFQNELFKPEIQKIITIFKKFNLDLKELDSFYKAI
ncbi:phosphomannomutase/phosphoglucomutase [Alphaproteobacteria bacterium]|nr:phosphomannomutase/phosphoglucomutase [Alphaproteobacteria bacterium]